MSADAIAQVARGSDEALLQFLYLMPVGVVECTPDGTVRMTNPQAVALLYALDPGDGCRNVFDALRTVAPDLAARIAAQGAECGLLLDQWQVGNLATRMLAISVLRVDDARLMIVLQDVTERAVADERFRVLLESLVDPYFVFDASGMIDCNQAAVTYTGATTREEALGISPERIVPCLAEDGRLWLQQGQRPDACQGDVRCRIDWSFRRPDGSALEVDVDMIPVWLRGKPAILAIWHDLTSHKAREAELRRARDAAHAAGEAKSEFLARMSHELRTPLNAIIGFTRLVLTRVPDLAPRWRDLLDRVASNGQVLLTLINDLLDLSRIEARRMPIVRAPHDLVALVRGAVGRIEDAPRAAGVKLLVEHPRQPLIIMTDEGRLQQVVTNLVANALKFTSQGAVTVRIAAGDEPGAATVAVVDTGIGIPRDRLASIFEPFEQAERATTRRFGGTGLGLAISRSIAETLGYTLDVESIEGVGSTFTLRIPAPSMADESPLEVVEAALR